MLRAANLHSIEDLLRYLNTTMKPPPAEIVPDSISLIDSNGESVGEIQFDSRGADEWVFVG